MRKGEKMKMKETIAEEVKKAIVSLFKPFVDEIISFDEAVRKMNEDAEKTEIEDLPEDWKILDVNCLSEIMDGDCEVRAKNESDTLSLSNPCLLAIFENLIYGYMEYEYRVIPAKKTHEELAREHANSGKYDSQEDWDISNNSFIAGRKSMEEEK